MNTRSVHYRFLLSAVVICGLLASPLLDITQAQSTGQADLSEAPVIAQEDAERKPIDCRGKPVVYSAGNETDNFVGPQAATLSPALQAYFVGKPRRNFDEGGKDKGFGQSFQLNCCKICRAVLEIRVRNDDQNGLASNDGLAVGVAPFTVRFAPAYTVWPSSSPLVRTISLPLNVSALNNYIMNSAGCPWWLDVYVQDDTAVDYVKLTVWYY